MKKRILSFILCLTLAFSCISYIGNNTLIVNAGNYSAKLLSEALNENEEYASRYSIEAFPVDLFDYDPKTFNTALDEKITGDNFKFVGYDTGVGSNKGVNDSTSTYAKQGIVQETLQNGLPVFNNVKDGVNNAKAFFDPTYTLNGKTSYEDVNFEFVYDNQTGYYEYKSCANHAQYNAQNKTIELYADSLSTTGLACYPIDLSNYYEDTRLEKLECNENFLKLKATPYDNTRLDSYFSIDVPAIEGKSIQEISIKLKVPKEVGETQFKVYFQTTEETGFSETRMFKADYEADGTAMTLRIKPSSFNDADNTEDAYDKWNKSTITKLRIDPFDNLDSSTNQKFENIPIQDYEIEVSDLTLAGFTGYPTIPTVTTSTNGGFYPFSDITSSYKASQPSFDLAAWSDLMDSSNTATALATRSIGNPSPTDLTANLAYGTVMEFDFYIPVDKPAEDLTYYFNGDDDLWVFVDNKLVLDIGGGHGAINGTINFTDGSATVANAVEISGYDSNKGNPAEKTTTLDEALTAPGKHTMKVFYLERCGSVSNCHMKFNLPRTPEGSVEVTKELNLTNVNQSSDDSSIKSNVSFNFEITMKGTLAGQDTTKKPYSGEYYVIDTTANTTTKTTNDGKFQLKHGEMASFIISEGYEVTVTEVSPPDIAGYDYISTVVNDTKSMSAAQTTANRTICTFAFINNYKEQPVTYTYIPVNPSDCPEAKKGTVELTGSPTSATNDEAGVAETIGTRIDDPTGSTATASDAVKFVGWYLDKECTESVPATVADVNGNILDPVKTNDLYPGDVFYAKFEYMYGDLRITKKGIENVDRHEFKAEIDSKAETQSTIYLIEGTSNSNVVINLEVVIDGNNSVTIKDIPVGTYTIKEKENWSWRYDAEAAEQIKVIEDGKTTEVSFENERNRKLWLSGDAYCENAFGSKQ